MTICVARLWRGNLGHGHRLFLSHSCQLRSAKVRLQQKQSFLKAPFSRPSQIFFSLLFGGSARIESLTMSLFVTFRAFLQT